VTLLQPASFTDPGLELPECEDRGAAVEEVDDVVEDTAGRYYRVRVLVCTGCGEEVRP
jgi:hypothetical protein